MKKDSNDILPGIIETLDKLDGWELIVDKNAKDNLRFFIFCDMVPEYLTKCCGKVPMDRLTGPICPKCGNIKPTIEDWTVGDYLSSNIPDLISIDIKQLKKRFKAIK